MQGKLLGAVRVKTEACVRIEDQMSSCFPITRGVRQGCVMSSWL